IADDVDAARTALREAHIPFEESELTTVLLENQAGELAAVATKLRSAGGNLHALHVGGLHGALLEPAPATDHPQKAKKRLVAAAPRQAVPCTAPGVVASPVHPLPVVAAAQGLPGGGARHPAALPPLPPGLGAAPGTDPQRPARRRRPLRRAAQGRHPRRRAAA